MYATCCILIYIYLKAVPNDPINYDSVGSDDGLAPNNHQAIIWTKGDPAYYAYMRHSVSTNWYNLKDCADACVGSRS